MSDEEMSPELADRIQAALQIDWSKVTPDMIVPADEWEAKMRCFVTEVMGRRHALIEQILAAVLVETGWGFDDVVVLETEGHDHMWYFEVKHVSELPDFSRSPRVTVRPADWALHLEWGPERLRQHLNEQAAYFERDYPGYDPLEAVLVEGKLPDGTYHWHIIRNPS